MSDDSRPVIEARAVTKVFRDFWRRPKVRAVDGISFEVRRGEVFGLLGPNGSGKSTTLKMILGLLHPTRGQLAVLGRSPREVRAKARVGYLPDEPVFYDYLRGGEIIRFVGEMHGFSKAEIAQRSTPLIERLELGDAIEEFAVNYSKGMKKKLALVCAMLHDPALLILDEPTNGLDPFATRSLHELMREKVAAGHTVFFSTHLLDQAEKLCDRVGIVYQGRLAAAGTVDELRGGLPQESTLEEVFFALTKGAAET